MNNIRDEVWYKARIDVKNEIKNEVGEEVEYEVWKGSWVEVRDEFMIKVKYEILNTVLGLEVFYE